MDAAYIGVMIAVIFTVPQCQAKIVMQGCINGRLSITDGQGGVITCTDVPRNELVTWTIRTLGETAEHTLGTCPLNEENCPSSDVKSYGMTRISHNQVVESELTILEKHRQMFSEKSVKCAVTTGDFAACIISVIHPATLSQCSIRGENTTLTGSCRVDKAFSSDGNYSCQWGIMYPDTTSTVNMPSLLVVMEYSDSGKSFYRGVCSFSYPLQDKDGTYTLFFGMPSGPSNIEVGRFSMQSGVFATDMEDQSNLVEIRVPSQRLSPLSLMCSAQPETRPSYKWNGLTCTNGYANEVCTFSPSNPTENVTCTATFNEFAYSGWTVESCLRLTFNLTSLSTASSAASVRTAPNQGSTSPTSTADYPSGDNHSSNHHQGTGYTTLSKSTDNGDNDDPLPVGAIGGGVGAAVVVIIVVVVIIFIWKKRSGSKKRRSEANDNDPEEHHNIAYEPGNSPYEVSDAYRPAAGKSKAQKQPAVATVDPANEDSNLSFLDDEPGYASPDNGRRSAGYTGLASGSGVQVHPEPLMDDGMYTSVDDPTPGSLAAAPEPSTHRDEYAVVDKSKKTNKQSYSQPKPAASGELYAQVNKSRPAPGGDVYAQVDKSSKRANYKPTQQNNVDGNYAEVQKPKPDLKPKPALKPKPTCAVKPSPRDSSGSLKTSGGDDEYNVLTFQGQHSDTPANPDAGQLYSHIGSEI